MNKQTLLKQLRKAQIISRKPVVLRSGLGSQLYIDIKKSYGDPKILNSVATLLSRKIAKNITAVAASGYGGLPLAAAIAIKKGLKLTLVREKPKGYGRKGWIDGHIPTQKDRIIIIDDVFTTGSSISATLKVLRKTKAKVIGAYVVVLRTDKKISIPVSYLFTLEEILET